MSAQNFNVNDFKKALQGADFKLTDAIFQKTDIFALTDAGIMATCNFQNAGAGYMQVKQPLQPGQAPCFITETKVNPKNEGLFNDFRLNPDEAIVMIGKTPPNCTYFSYDLYVGARWNPDTQKPVIIFTNTGDTLNQMVLNTDGTASDPYNKNTMIIISPNKSVASKIREIANANNIPNNIINEYPLPRNICNLGLNKESDTFTTVCRFTYPTNANDGQNYLDNPQMTAFRITPTNNSVKDYYAIPKARVRGNGDCKEFELKDSLNNLRNAILAENKNLYAQELITAPFIRDGYEGMQEWTDLWAPARDTVYLKCSNFVMNDNDGDFAIVYGVNHAAMGKATYANISAYGEANNGVAGAWNKDYENTAQKYLPNDTNAKFLYVWKFSRSPNVKGNSTTLGNTCVPSDKNTTGLSNVNVIPLYEQMSLGFRAYLEPSTKTGPSTTEIVFDRVIKFNKKF